jgi:hypothetical protein
VKAEFILVSCRLRMGTRFVPGPNVGHAGRRPELVGWLIVLIIVLAIIGLVAVFRAIF